MVVGVDVVVNFVFLLARGTMLVQLSSSSLGLVPVIRCMFRSMKIMDKQFIRNSYCKLVLSTYIKKVHQITIETCLTAEDTQAGLPYISCIMGTKQHAHLSNSLHKES